MPIKKKKPDPGTIRRREQKAAGPYKCLHCEKEYSTQVGNFFTTKSELYKYNGNYLTVCRHCCMALYNMYLTRYENDCNKAFYNLCAYMGWYFNAEEMKLAMSQSVDFIGKYVGRLSIGKCKGKTFDYNLIEFWKDNDDRAEQLRLRESQLEIKESSANQKINEANVLVNLTNDKLKAKEKEYEEFSRNKEKEYNEIIGNKEKEYTEREKEYANSIRAKQKELDDAIQSHRLELMSLKNNHIDGSRKIDQEIAKAKAEHKKELDSIKEKTKNEVNVVESALNSLKAELKIKQDQFRIENEKNKMIIEELKFNVKKAGKLEDVEKERDMANATIVSLQNKIRTLEIELDNSIPKDDDYEVSYAYEDEEQPMGLRELQLRWGAGLDMSDYEFLEEEYSDWAKEYNCGSKNLKTLVEEICQHKLIIRKKRANGDPTKDDVKNLQDLMGSGNLKPYQETGAAAAEQSTFGNFIKHIENDEPIPEPTEEFRDVDGIRKYMRIWFTGHLSKIFGRDNEYSREYEEELAKYTVEKPEIEEDEDVSEL